MCDNKLYKIFRKLSAGRRYNDAAHNIDKKQYKVGAVVLLRISKKPTPKGSKMYRTLCSSRGTL